MEKLVIFVEVYQGNSKLLKSPRFIIQLVWGLLKMASKKRESSQILSEEDQAYEKSVKLLGMRMHSVSELTKKLQLRKFSAIAIRDAITRLKQNRFLDDENYAEVYLNNLLRYKTWGYYGIKAKMMQKGIEGSIAEALLNEHLDLETEIKLAKKFLGKRGLDPQKTGASLGRRGFRAEVIRKILE